MPLDGTIQQRPRAKPPLGLLEALADLERTLALLRPRARTAKDKLALDYWGASEAQRLGEAWREKAKRAAIAGGVLPDHTADPLPVGTSTTVYASSLLTIGLKVVRQADRVDVAGLLADLEAYGVKPSVLKRMLKKRTELLGGAHIFRALLAA